MNRKKAENKKLDQEIDLLEAEKKRLELLLKQKADKKEELAAPVPMELPEVKAEDVSENKKASLLEEKLPQNENVLPGYSQDKIMDMIETLNIIYSDYKNGQQMSAPERIQENVGVDDNVILIYEQGNSIFRTICNLILLVLFLTIIGGGVLLLFDFLSL